MSDVVVRPAGWAVIAVDGQAIISVWQTSEEATGRRDKLHKAQPIGTYEVRQVFLAVTRERDRLAEEVSSDR